MTAVCAEDGKRLLKPSLILKLTTHCPKALHIATGAIESSIIPAGQVF
jgi:hypothetical protein